MEKEDMRILLITDENQNITEVVASLKSKGFSLEVPANPEAGRDVLKEYKPHALLLSFHTFELTEVYHLSLQQDEGLSTIFLCTISEVDKAFRLLTAGKINDYFILNPIYDPNRLSVCIQHIFNNLKLREELRESQEKENFNMSAQFQEESEQAQMRLVQSIEEKLAEFEKKMASSEFNDAVEVKDLKKLAQHFDHLKNEEFESAFESFQEESHDSFDGYFGELKTLYHKRLQRERNHIQESHNKKSPYSILVVEDDPQSMELLVEILEIEGFKVYQARNGKIAAMLVSKNLPNLILMDIQIPGIDGLKLTQKLKRHPKFKDIPIVMVTAHTSQAILQQSLKVRASGLIAKPISRKVVLDKIREFLN